MFIAFISKAFVDSYITSENRKSKHFVSFVSDFFQKLNIDYLICDFDIADQYNDLHFQLTIGALYQYCRSKIVRLEKSIEYYLTEGFDELASTEHYAIIEPYFPGKSIFLININKETLENFSAIKSLNVISSCNFTETYQAFLIDGRLNDTISQEEFRKSNISFNPWDCKKCNSILIDDQYIIKRDKDGILDERIINGILLKILEDFIENNDDRKKTIIFAIPNRPGMNAPWLEEEKGFIVNALKRVTNELCPESTCKIIFHDLSSHPRRMLTNMHLFSMSDGFDVQLKFEKYEKYTNQRTDEIRFESVFIQSSWECKLNCAI
jgi:hypothetical protein